MRAIEIPRPGPADVLRVVERPDPSAASTEVVVRVAATAVNRADVLQRLGRYPAPPGVAPDVPGIEFAGTVEHAGSDVRSPRVGDRVMGIVGGGAYAERIAVAADLCLPIPPAMDPVEAAAIPEAFLTAFDAWFSRGRLSPGEVALVTAAGSGVGTAAIQLAALSGARVVATSRTAAKRERLESLGAIVAIDPAAPDFASAVRRAVAGAGVDVALELTGRDGFPGVVESLAVGGRIVVVGVLSGARVELDLAALMSRRATVTGTVLRSRPLFERVALTRAFARRGLPWLAGGRARAVVDRTLPLEEAAAAHRAIERGETFGKIVLTTGA